MLVTYKDKEPQPQRLDIRDFNKGTYTDWNMAKEAINTNYDELVLAKTNMLTEEAPLDGKTYVRKDGEWITILNPDIRFHKTYPPDPTSTSTIDSPIGNYLGNDITGLDIEFQYRNLVTDWFIDPDDDSEVNGLTLAGQNILGGLGSTFMISFLQHHPLVNPLAWGGVVIGSNTMPFQLSIPFNEIPVDGDFKITSDGVNIIVTMNGDVLINEPVVDTDISGISVDPLTFGGFWFAGTSFGNSNVDLSYVKINEHEWNFNEGTGNTTTNSQGIISTLRSTPIPGVKFIAANDEFIKSPSAQYLPDTIAEIDIEIDFQPISEGFITYLFSTPISTAVDVMVVLHNNTTDELQITIRTATVNQNFIASVSVADMTGNLKIQGNESNLEVYLNDDLIIDDLVTISQDMTAITGELWFNCLAITPVFTFGHGNVKMSRVKIQDHVWTFSEQTGSTTTNSQSVVSTLNSNVSTEAMWTITSTVNNMWVF